MGGIETRQQRDRTAEYNASCHAGRPAGAVDTFATGRAVPRAISHRLAHMPFAAGHRRCVGQHMAATEMRVHPATLRRRFTPTWLGDGEPRIASTINPRPADGIHLQLTRRS